MHKWTQAEDNLLAQHYQLPKIELAKLFPHRSQAAINIRASKLGLKKQRNEYCQSKLDILLDDTHPSYYWMGFILADGSFTKHYRLTVTLAHQDLDHLTKLAEYLQTTLRVYDKSSYPKAVLSCQDKFVIPKLMSKFDANFSKTYNPPSCLPSDNELLTSLFIGYCDGDGSLGYQYKRTDCLLRIRVHNNWLCWLLEINQRLGLSNAQPKLSKDNYAIWNIANNGVLRKLKRHALKYKLPMLERKWNKLSLF